MSVLSPQCYIRDDNRGLTDRNLMDNLRPSVLREMPNTFVIHWLASFPFFSCNIYYLNIFKKSPILCDLSNNSPMSALEMGPGWFQLTQVSPCSGICHGIVQSCVFCVARKGRNLAPSFLWGQGVWNLDKYFFLWPTNRLF